MFSLTNLQMDEMLDDLFRGIRRDIGVEVSRYMYNSLMNHTRVDFNEVDRLVIDTFYMTDKPCGVNHKLWDDILETIRTGIDIGINMTWDMHVFYDEDLEEDEIMIYIMVIMGHIFTRISHRFGLYMLREIEEADQAALRIQREWRDAIANPSRNMCRSRLIRECSELV